MALFEKYGFSHLSWKCEQQQPQQQQQLAFLFTMAHTIFPSVLIKMLAHFVDRLRPKCNRNCSLSSKWVVNTSCARVFFLFFSLLFYFYSFVVFSLDGQQNWYIFQTIYKWNYLKKKLNWDANVKIGFCFIFCLKDN